MLPTILVIGCGSIGERHVRTFLKTGRCRIVACDTRPAVLAAMTEHYGVPTAADWRAALQSQPVHAVVIATPANSHVGIALEALEHGCHCLIEKPLSLNLDGLAELRDAQRQSGRAVAIGYVQHLRPEIAAARAFIRSGQFGRPCHAAVVTGQHFPTFRPAYREIYYRDRAQGGGAIQDALTHMANAMEWMLGPTRTLYCDAGHQALPGVEVEDTVSVIARTDGGAMVSYTLTQFQAPNELTILVNAERGSVKVELHHNRWGQCALEEKDWTWHAQPAAERDAMYVAQADAFLNACEGRPSDLATLDEGIQSVRFNLAAFESLKTKAAVEVGSLGAPVTPAN
jgi:predicted dehydrogenase